LAASELNSAVLNEITALAAEAEELAKIIGKIIVNTKL
jgi:hypothetical protein